MTNLPASVLTRSQKRVEGWKEYKEGGTTYRIQAEIRFDDDCGNGHNSFSITGETQRRTTNGRWMEDSCGCIHEEIAKHFPEFEKYIKWHSTSTDGPLHYTANVLYFAGDKDHNGLRKGESRQTRNGRTGLPCWILEQIGDELPRYVDAENRPSAPQFVYAPLCHKGEGKEREFDAARRGAVWPEATDAELSLPSEELKAKLLARLPALMLAFKADMEELGFTY